MCTGKEYSAVLEYSIDVRSTWLIVLFKSLTSLLFYYMSYKLLKVRYLSLTLLLSVPLVCGSVFVPVPYCLINVALQYSLKSENMISPALFFILKIVLAIWGLLFFYTKFRIASYRNIKSALSILMQIVLNLYRWLQVLQTF